MFRTADPAGRSAERQRESPSNRSPDPTGKLGAMPDTYAPSYAAHSRLLSAFDRFAAVVTRWTGSPVVFAGALASIVLWAALGRAFDYSDGWQLVINTGTTIVTFLMVFLIQQAQNKDSIAVHLKLNELLASSKQASNRMIGIEDLDEQDLRDVAAFYVGLAERAKQAGAGKEMHSIDEEGLPAEPRHLADSDAPAADVGPRRAPRRRRRRPVR